MVLVMKNSVGSLAQFLSNALLTCWDTVQSFLIGRGEQDLQFLVNAFDGGRDVSFGALTLSQEGICSEADIIPWSALRSLRYETRELVFVRQRGNQFSSLRIPAAHLKNLPVLLHLIDQATQRQVPSLGY
jgi:hypothetical protein